MTVTIRQAKELKTSLNFLHGYISGVLDIHNWDYEGLEDENLTIRLPDRMKNEISAISSRLQEAEKEVEAAP